MFLQLPSQDKLNGHRRKWLTIHTQIALNLTGCELHHHFSQRWLDTYPEGVVHHVVGVDQVAGKIVGSQQLAVGSEEWRLC